MGVGVGVHSCVSATPPATSSVPIMHVMHIFPSHRHPSCSHEPCISCCPLPLRPAPPPPVAPRYYRLTWCVQALAGLAAASLVEDRCGVAQLSTPGLGGVLGALLGLAAGLGAYNKRVVSQQQGEGGKGGRALHMESCAALCAACEACISCWVPAKYTSSTLC